MRAPRQYNAPSWLRAGVLRACSCGRGPHSTGPGRAPPPVRLWRDGLSSLPQPPADILLGTRRQPPEDAQSAQLGDVSQVDDGPIPGAATGVPLDRQAVRPLGAARVAAVHTPLPRVPATAVVVHLLPHPRDGAVLQLRVVVQHHKPVDIFAPVVEDGNLLAHPKAVRVHVHPVPQRREREHVDRRLAADVSPERRSEPDVLDDERMRCGKRADAVELGAHTRAFDKTARHLAPKSKERTVGVRERCGGTRRVGRHVGARLRGSPGADREIACGAEVA
eukprot:7250151-Prymnesium_polylepis.1